MAIAIGAINLGIPLIAAVPFAVGQESRWSTLDQMQYRRLLNRASHVEVVCDGGYTPQAMQLRNQYIVDNCQVLMALCKNTSGSGGTVNCINYALSQGRKTFNCWQTFLHFYSQG